MNFEPVIRRYEEELFDRVVPFWEKNCVDREFGGYFTSFDRDGSVYDTEKYMWMQWRIVYMFATLCGTEHRREEWLRIAQDGFNFLTRHGKSQDGTYYFALNRRGEPSVAPYNIFSDCFAAMGAAALYKVTHNDVHLREAHSAMESYIRRMDNPKGCWNKVLAGHQKFLSLGHFMILANLASVMKDCLGCDTYDSDARRAVDTVVGKFWNKDFKVIFENIRPDGTFDLDSCEGRFINPGHGLESMWFILQYAEKAGNRKLIDFAAEIVKGIFEFGTDKECGGIYYFMDVLGKPHLELQWDMKLWWPHNEAAIAAIYAYRLTGDDYFLGRFKEVDEWSWAHFRDPDYPEWFAYLNRDGKPTHMLKGGKWKTFFHLPRYLLLCTENMKKMSQSK